MCEKLGLKQNLSQNLDLFGVDKNHRDSCHSFKMVPQFLLEMNVKIRQVMALVNEVGQMYPEQIFPGQMTPGQNSPRQISPRQMSLGSS